MLFKESTVFSRPALVLLNNGSAEKCLHLLVKKGACFLHDIKRDLLDVKCNNSIVKVYQQ